MGREVRPSGHAALYGWLLERAELEAQHPMPLPGNASRLAALRAGEAADVPVGELPPWARITEPEHWWRRAVVACEANGVLDFYDDDGRRWLADNGL